MKQWNGLLKKEWVSMKGWLYGTVGASILFVLIIPFVVSMFVKGVFDVLLFALIPSWILFSLILPVIVLLNSLKKETGRLDIWLHSPVSIFKLFGVKAIFAGFVGAVNLFFATFVGSIQLSNSNLDIDFAFSGAGVVFIFVLFLVSLMAMCIGLFARVLYLVIEPSVKVFAIPILVGFFFVVSWIFQRIEGTMIYEKITTFGPIRSVSKNGFSIEKEQFFFEANETIFHTGDLLVNVLFTILLFVTSAVLFEKKVRF
ncbi:hypothetical protein [Sporosarcina sp. G11-34]|uniref:hypothetical protein n=1 Tax=Sporosarcina sp. G11-34 TaxID=2849605 RepID=UPI0022A9814C|nr:hypothetical protein [Sporosarcina sp. G11-34]MCZ2259111.1 hypothetical protein [Sporosarcina sp. G11-34]